MSFDEQMTIHTDRLELSTGDIVMSKSPAISICFSLFLLTFIPNLYELLIFCYYQLTLCSISECLKRNSTNLPLASKNSSLVDHLTDMTAPLWPFKICVDDPDLRSHSVMWSLKLPTEKREISSLGRKTLICAFGPWTCMQSKYLIKAHKNYFKTCSMASNTFRSFCWLSCGPGTCIKLISFSS